MTVRCVLTRSPRTAAGMLAVPFYFQSAPIENFAVEETAEWTDFDTLGRKRFSRPTSMQLVPITFDTVFTDFLMDEVPRALQQYLGNLTALGLSQFSIDAISSHPFFAPPGERVRELRAIERSMTPFVLTVADDSILKVPVGNAVSINTGDEISMEATLRTVRWEERAGEPDALYVTASFMQYAPIDLATTTRGGAKGAEGGTRKLTIRTLKNDEITIARLAKKFYGDASKVTAIYALNKPWLQEIGRNENLRSLALGTAPSNTRNKRLTALLKKHPQIIIPVLKGAAATTRATTTTYVGQSGG